MTNDRLKDDVERDDTAELDTPEAPEPIRGECLPGGFSAPLGHTHPALRPQSNT